MSASTTGCWRRIGVLGGDHSCALLADVLHCRNCAVHGEAARSLFDREAPAEADIIDLHAAPRPVGEVAVLLFRIGGQWLTLAPAAVVEIAEAGAATRIAHRTRGRVTGVVNVRGELHLEVALASLLGLEHAAEVTQARLLLVRDPQGAVTACRVDEMRGVVHLDPAKLQPVPDNLAAGLRAVLRGFAIVDELHAGLLDETALALALQEALYA